MATLTCSIVWVGGLGVGWPQGAGAVGRGSARPQLGGGEAEPATGQERVAVAGLQGAAGPALRRSQLNK